MTKKDGVQTWIYLNELEEHYRRALNRHHTVQGTLMRHRDEQIAQDLQQIRRLKAVVVGEIDPEEVIL